MRALFYRYKIIIPIFFISIVFNLFWFSIFIYLSLEFPLYRVSLTILFLLFYMMMAQPAKDYFIHSIFFKLLYPDTENKVIKDKRIKALVKKSEIPILLKVLIKELNIGGISMITVNHPFTQINFLRDADQKVDKISNENFLTISKYFQTNIQNTLSVQMPDEIKNIANYHTWRTIIPIYFKSRYFGFLAVQVSSDLKKIITLEALAGRIGLILENEILTESAINNESFKKEFTFARRVEKFLIEPKPLEIDGSLVTIDKGLSGIVNFPLLFERSIVEKDYEGQYIIFCKISKSNRKMRTMMLFMIAGYFLSICRYSKTLRDLYRSLNQALNKNGAEFSIDGFLIQKTSALKWKFCYFGKNIRVKIDGRDLKLNQVAAMGANKTENFRSVNLENKKEISFYLNPMVCLRINEK